MIDNRLLLLLRKSRSVALKFSSSNSTRCNTFSPHFQLSVEPQSRFYSSFQRIIPGASVTRSLVGRGLRSLLQNDIKVLLLLLFHFQFSTVPSYFFIDFCNQFYRMLALRVRWKNLFFRVWLIDIKVQIGVKIASFSFQFLLPLTSSAILWDNFFWDSLMHLFSDTNGWGWKISLLFFSSQNFCKPSFRNFSNSASISSKSTGGVKLLVTAGPKAQKAVGIWLFVSAAWVFSMVVLGGVTRLTRSGLSMTDWKFTGGLPPMSDDEWLVEFEKYKQSPEYKR